MHIGIDLVDWLILGIGSAEMAAFMQLLILLLLLIRGACTGAVAGCRADFADDGDDSRRRKPNWKDWTHTGLPDVGEVEDDDNNGDDPEIWLRRAKKFGLAHENRRVLRRRFFYK